MLSSRESAALEACKAHVDLVDLQGGLRCYIASAALQDLLGGPKAGYSLVKAANGSGDHYWVVNEHGIVLDPTKDQLDGQPPYRQGKKVQKRNNLTKHLPLLEAMQEDVPAADDASPRDVFGRPLVAEKDAPLSDDQRKKLALAWRSLVADWAERPEEFIRSTFPKGALAVYFVRALLYGEEIPRTATLAYTWDRYYVAGSHRPFNEMLPAALEDPRVLRGIRFVLSDEISFTKLLGGNLPVLGYRMPFDFPIGLARELIDKYCPAGGRVLDPCHGWGGRLVGFMLSQASSYVGVDTAPHGHKLQEMFDDLSEYLFQPKKIRLINKPFEDVSLKEASYDFALTSPPYYSTEKYLGDQSSWRRYKTLDDWIDGFYCPLIVGMADALKPGAYAVVQTTTKFSMVEVAKEVGAKVGLEYVGVRDTAMRRYNSASADKAGATDLFEVFTILRKR